MKPLSKILCEFADEGTVGDAYATIESAALRIEDLWVATEIPEEREILARALRFLRETIGRMVEQIGPPPPKHVWGCPAHHGDGDCDCYVENGSPGE